MESKIIKVSDCENEVEVTLSYEEIQPEITEAYNKRRKEISMDGFRKGMVPMPIIKKVYGQAIEYGESENIANTKFWDLVKEQNIKVLSTPKLKDLNYEPSKSLSFKISYEVTPALDLKDYKNLKIEKPVFTVKDEQIESEFNYLLRSNSTFEPAELIADKQFRITVSLEKINEQGEVEPGSKSKDTPILLNDEKVNPELIQNAIGKKLGESFEFTFTDEHKHGEETHKIEYRYKATINRIDKIVPPELNENFVKKFSNSKASTVEEMKQLIRDDIEKYYSNQSEHIYSSSLFDKIITNNDFKAPEGFVKLISKRLLDAEKETARTHRRNIPDDKTMIEQLKPKAEWNAKWEIILDNLARIESVTVSDQELEELAEQEAAKTSITKEKLLKYYESSNRKEQLLEDKIVKFLREENPPVEVNADEASQTEEKSEAELTEDK